MKTKKTLVCLLSLIMSLCLGFCIAGCNGGNGNKDNLPQMTISATSLEIGLFDSKVLTVETKNVDSTIVWESSNPTVATVVDGKVTAVNMGDATITVSAGELSQTCAVKVVRGSLTPEFDALDDSLILVKGAAYPLDVTMALNGVIFDNATIAYQVVGEDGFISINDDGVINAINYGEQDIVVTATYNGITLATKTISVNVIESGSIETGISNNALTLTATAIASDSVNVFDATEFKAFVNGQNVYKAITLTSADSSIVEIDGMLIVGKKQGTTSVTAQFTADSNKVYDVKITVSVIKETATYTTNFFEKSSNDAKTVQTGTTEIDLSSANLPIELSEITKVISNGVELEYVANEDVLTLTNAPAGENNYKLVTDRVDLVINGFIYQSTISSADEYKAWFANIGSYVGYTILTTDVNLNGATVNSPSWWAGTLDGRGHTVSNFVTTSGFMAQSNEKAIVRNLQIVNMVAKSTNIIGSSYTGHMQNVLILAKISDALDNQNVVMSGEYNDCELENVIMVVTADNPNAEYWGFGKSYSQGNGITTRNAYLVFDGEITLKKESATNNKTVLCEDIEGLMAEFNAQAFEDAGWVVSDAALPYMSDYSSHLENVFYSAVGDFKANSTVTIDTSLFDAQYSLKETIDGISISENVITIGNVSVATEFTLVVKSANFDDVTIEIPLQTYNYNEVTYGADYIALSDAKTTLNLDEVPGFAGEVKKIAINGLSTPFTVEGTIVTFDNNEVGVQNIAIYSATDVYTFDVLIADVVVTNASELFAVLRLNSAKANRRYVVLANDIELDDTEFNSGFCMSFVFDGLGHTIYNGYEYSGLFCNDANNLIVKNVNFVNFKTATSIFGGKFVGDMLFENVNFINTKFPGFNSAQYLLYNANYDGCNVTFKNCNFDFTLDSAHVEKVFKLLSDDGKYASINFENVKITSNGIVVKFGEDGYGADFVVTNTTIIDSRDITKVTYDGSPLASSTSTIIDLSKLSVEIVPSSIKSTYIGGAEVDFEIIENELYVNKPVIGMTEIEIYAESKVYNFAVTVVDYSTSVTYDAEYVKNTDGEIVFNLNKIENFSGTVIKVNNGNAVLEFEQEDDTLIVMGSTAWNTSTFTIHTANVGYKFSVLVVTDIISDESSWKAFMENGATNRYALFTSDVNIASEYELKTAFINSVVIDGAGHTVGGAENVYNWSGLFANSISSSTVKNLTFKKIKGFASVLGGSFNDVTFENVTIQNGFAPGGKSGNNLLLSYVGENKFATFKNCTIALTIDTTKIDNQYVLCGLKNGAELNFIDTVITYNGTMVKPGETFNDAVWGETGVTLENSILRDKDDIIVATATYEDEYVALTDGKVTVDLAKVSEEIVSSKITKVAVAGVPSTFEVSGNNLVATTSVFGENKAIEITVDNGDTVDVITINVIIANFVLTDETSFKAWITAGHGAAGGKYAVVANDITLTADVQLDTPWFGGWTLNGLGNTVSNIYDYSGMFPGGAGNITMKNITLNMKTCSSAFGDDWYGTNNFINVTIKVTVPGHAGTSRLLFDRVRADTKFNFTDCTFTFNVDSGLQANSMALMKLENSGIVVNFVNTDITSTGTIDAIVSNYVLDANSSITDKNGTK